MHPDAKSPDRGLRSFRIVLTDYVIECVPRGSPAPLPKPLNVAPRHYILAKEHQICDSIKQNPPQVSREIFGGSVEPGRSTRCRPGTFKSSTAQPKRAAYGSRLTAQRDGTPSPRAVGFEGSGAEERPDHDVEGVQADGSRLRPFPPSSQFAVGIEGQRVTRKKGEAQDWRSVREQERRLLRPLERRPERTLFRGREQILLRAQAQEPLRQQGR